MTTSKQFYNKLKAEGLAKRKSDIATKKELAYLENVLNKNQKILDLACGYGRFTIPLAKKGYKIEGLDITPALIKEAKKYAKREKVNINFRVGDMRKLPYKNESFGAIICMWTAFNELTTEKDQLNSIKEMLRVLEKGGFAFIEMPALKKLKGIIRNEKTHDELYRKGNLVCGKLEGIEKMPTYLHDKKTFKNLMNKAKVTAYKIFIDDFGGRDRLLVQFYK